jgi:nicotinate-nucleotide adenylyltransferase
MSVRQRLGLLGGSFDPIHVGHLHAARAAQKAFELDRVVFVPAARPPHKPGVVLASGADRLAMVELAIAGEPTWSASGIELDRPGPSYTIDTVRELARTPDGPEDALIHLIVGSDNLAGLVGWRDAHELLERVQPIVIFREDAGDAGGEDILREACAALPEALALKLERGYLRLPPVDVSASELRGRFTAGADPGAKIPEPVAEYIRSRGLYRPAP